VPIALPSPLLYAHRGAPLELPENTVEGFRRGLELGAGAIETDVHLTADEQVVVSHDPDGARLAGVPAAIKDCTLAEVQRWDLGARFLSRGGQRLAGLGFRVPTLEQVLAEFPRTPFNVDLKQHTPAMVDAILALLRRLGAEDRVLLASFSGWVLGELRRRGYPGRLGLGRRQIAAVALLPTALLAGRFRRHDAAQIPTHVGPYRLDRANVIARCHALGLRVDYWTINDPEQARALWRLGADGVMTDDVAAIAPVHKSVARWF
jgi:glycerophosphoryl diester phosphodiesterase